VVISTSPPNVKRTQILQQHVPSALGITQHHTKAVPNSNCSRKDDLQSKPTGHPKPKTPPQLQSKPTPFKIITFPHFVNPNGAPPSLPQNQNSPMPTPTLKKSKSHGTLCKSKYRFHYNPINKFPSPIPIPNKPPYRTTH